MNTSRTLATLALLVYLITGIGYSLIVPPFETPDEAFHYAFARHIAQGNGLPVQGEGISGPWEQEGSQAPLYYLLTGWLTRAIEQSDFEAINAINVVNPYANIGTPLYPGNKNRNLYSAVDWPLTGSNLALHIGRWLSLLLCTLSLLCSYATARLVFPHNPRIPLLALWIAATIPQFAFIGASFSNDTLITATAALTLYWLCRIVNSQQSTANGQQPTINTRHSPLATRHWLFLGLFLGLAALSKLHGLALLPLAGVVILWDAWRQRSGRVLFAASFLTSSVFLLVAGWWYWRNYTLYHDWLGTSHLLAINGGRTLILALDSLWGEFRGLRYSFWGLFGWFSILLPTWFYPIMDGVTGIGVIGCLVEGWQVASGEWRMASGTPRHLVTLTSASSVEPSPCHPVMLVAAWAFLGLALIVYWSSQAVGSQGRLLFPALGAYVILLAAGIDWWVRRIGQTGLRRLVYASVPALLFAMSIDALFVLLPQSYRAIQTVDKIPAIAQPVAITYRHAANRLELLAVEMPVQRVQPGDTLPVTLYLRTPASMAQNYPLFLQLLDEKGAILGNITTHAGWGRNPTQLWQPNTIYADAYAIPVQNLPDPSSPLLSRLYVGFIDPATVGDTKLPIDAFDETGAPVEPMPATVVIEPIQPVELASTGVQTDIQPDVQEVGTEFGSVVRLLRVRYADKIDKTSAQIEGDLLWEATGQPATDYTLFVHLRDEQGKPIAGVDQPPAGARFPTAYWRKGDRVRSHFVLPVPSLAAGKYLLWVGLYESQSGGALRLPISNAAGQVTGDGEVQIGVVTR